MKWEFWWRVWCGHVKSKWASFAINNSTVVFDILAKVAYYGWTSLSCWKEG
jgi:hypothetical protein